MLKIAEDYFENLESKIKNGTVTEEDDIEFQENIEKIYTEMKKWTFTVLWFLSLSVFP